MKYILSFLALVAVMVFYVISIYNQIITYDEVVSEKFSQVQNTYKRRADLVPNLVKTVKGYAKHEKETLLEVVNARKVVSQVKLDSKDLSDPAKLKAFSQAQNALSSALSKLMVVVERYPDLKASKNFLALQSQLEGTENRIAVARRDYIVAIKDYNRRIRTFPGNIVANNFCPDAKIKENFSIEEKDKKVPEVSFE